MCSISLWFSGCRGYRILVTPAKPAPGGEQGPGSSSPEHDPCGVAKHCRRSKIRSGGALGPGLRRDDAKFWCLLPSTPPAYVDRDAADKVGVARCQKADDLGLVGRRGEAQWGARDLRRLRLRRAPLPMRADALGQSQARRNRVDRDAEGPKLKGELAGEGNDPAL